MPKGWSIVIAGLLLLAPAVPLAAQQEAEDLCQVIRDLGDKKITPRGKTTEAFRAEFLKHTTSLIERCEAFLKRFPDAPQAGEVMYEQARALIYRSRYSDTKKEDTARGVALALKSVERAPKADAALKSRGLLIQHYKMSGQNEEVLRQAEAVIKDFPGTPDVVVALRLMAETCEGMKKDAEALALWEKLAAEYPETPQGKRAAGVLVFRKLKDNPLALAFTSTTGEAVDAAKHRGKVVLVYFWTTGDESSKANMELLVKVDKALGDRGLVVLGVCMSTEQAAMESECKASGASWPEYFDGKRWDNEMATKLGIREFPTTILADRSGKVREVGLLAEPLVDAVRKLLDETGK